MIKVSHNEKGQIITTCDTVEEFGSLTYACMTTMAGGHKETVKIMIASMAIMPLEEFKDRLMSAPTPESMKPLKEFMVEVCKEKCDMTSPLSKAGTDGTTNEDILNMIMPELTTKPSRETRPPGFGPN